MDAVRWKANEHEMVSLGNVEMKDARGVERAPRVGDGVVFGMRVGDVVERIAYSDFVGIAGLYSVGIVD